MYLQKLKFLHGGCAWMAYQQCLIFGIGDWILLVFVKFVTRTWNQLTMLCSFATMHRKPRPVGLIALWTSLLQLRTSLVSWPNSLRNGLPLIWTSSTRLLGLFGETEQCHTQWCRLSFSSSLGDSKAISNRLHYLLLTRSPFSSHN